MKYRLTLYVLVALAIALPNNAHARIERDKAHRRAFLVGCQDYGAIPGVKYAKRDVEELRRVLVSRCDYHAEKIVTLVDQPSNRIKSEFDEFLKQVDPSDTVLIYFSGHGESQDDEGYLVPRDGYETNKTQGRFDPRRSISTSMWTSELKRANAAGTLLILDACHSGAGALALDNLKTRGADANFAVISSCQGAEQSYELDIEGHGIFTYVLIHSLRGEGLPRSRTSIDLAFLRTRFGQVSSIAKDLGNDQTPLLIPQQGVNFDIAEVKLPDSMVELKAADPNLQFKLRIPLVRVEPTPTDAPFEFGSDLEAVGMTPLCRVTLTRPFLIGSYEITECQYDTVMERPETRATSLPVTEVSWFDAVEFCNRLSSREGREPYYEIKNPKYAPGKKWIEDAEVNVPNQNGLGYRLPTEAEWEYAARAGTQSLSVFGNTLTSDKANFDGRAPFRSITNGPDLKIGTALFKPKEVGSYIQPNLWGLYDVHGNVDEWCHDLYQVDFFQKGVHYTDPTGPSVRVVKDKNGTTKILGHVVRGGSFKSGGIRCLLSARAERGSGSIAGGREILIGLMNPATGFRIVRTVSVKD